MSFDLLPQAIPDVVLVRSRLRRDPRGDFQETFRRSAYAAAGLATDFVQDNHVPSGPGVLLGLHYLRPPAAQGKLVRVVRGRIFDVAVDVRRQSPTFCRSAACELSGDGGDQLWIPPGFSHGYVVLSDGAEVAYKVTAEYAPDRDRGIRWDDPTLAMPWPLPTPPLSDWDRELPLLPYAELA